MSQIKIDDLKDIVAESFVSGLRGALEGSSENIKAFAVSMSAAAVQAHVEGDTEGLAELEATMEALMESNRVRFAQPLGAIGRVTLGVTNVFLARLIDAGLARI